MLILGNINSCVNHSKSPLKVFDTVWNPRVTLCDCNLVLNKPNGNTKGADANVADFVTDENLESVVTFAKDFTKKAGAVIAIRGAIDIVTDSKKAYCI